MVVDNMSGDVRGGGVGEVGARVQAATAVTDRYGCDVS